MNSATRFEHPLAVDAWDAWFRWRTADGLRDLTIDDTWRRVADAIASVESAATTSWSSRFFQALGQWQMLPDEATLAHAGTGRGKFAGPRAAVLNIAAFVLSDRSSLPRIDHARLHAVAGLAVRFVCDAVRGDHDAGVPTVAPHIAPIGLADALARLGLDYDSDAARRQAADIVSVIADGCVEGLRECAVDSAFDISTIAALVDPQVRDMSTGSMHDARRRGMRPTRLTAIVPHPRLALLANHVGDMLDAAMDTQQLRHDATIAGLLSPPIAATLRPWHQPSPAGRNGGACSPVARIRMRAAVQPWIDRPIDAPLLVEHWPDAETMAQCDALARRHGLPAPRWLTMADNAML